MSYSVTRPADDAAHAPDQRARVPQPRSLYRVNMRGAQYGVGTHQHFVAYVVATNADEAYETVRRSLADADIGTDRDRQMASVDLVASEGRYPRAECTLYIVGG